MGQQKKAAVLGAGSWGTALAHHLSRAGADVTLWGRDAAIVQSIAAEKTNPRYFPDEKLSPSLKVTGDLNQALAGSSLVVFAVPAAAMRQVAGTASAAVPADCVIVSTAKGLETSTAKTMAVVLGEELPHAKKVTVLSGPSFALEVLKGMPTAVVIAGQSESWAKEAAAYFHYEYFRVYTSADIIGVELGGAAKNVIALAAGVADGVGMGSNARAALITRGVAEMKRLLEAAGGETQTASGLSGLGDLLLTATGDLSRNRRVGLRLGKGEPLAEILSSIGQTAEATTSARTLRELGEKLNVALPIIEQVDRMLAGEIKVEQALQNLFARERKTE